MDEEEKRKEALDINYKLGKYGTKFCCNCSHPIEEYENITSGLCEECREELNN